MANIRQWWVPGRANLIGEHVDHCGGSSLAFGVDRGLTMKARPRSDGQVALWALGKHTVFPVGYSIEAVPAWANRVAAAALVLADGPVPVRGADLVIESDLPAGIGLGSSAAALCGTLIALSTLAGHPVSPEELVALAYRAETGIVGVPVGALDPQAIVSARQGQISHLDFADGSEVVGHLPASWESAGMTMVVIDTASKHDHASSLYRVRREECDQASEALGLDRLARAGLNDVITLSDPTLQARVRHVFTEQTRVKAAARAIRDANWTQLGVIMSAAHASLRDDFACSSPTQDLAVDVCVEQGALGARMMGGGFGGSVIALVPTDRGEVLSNALKAAFARHEWPLGAVMPVRAAGSIRQIS